jgi:hypothetical protein
MKQRIINVALWLALALVTAFVVYVVVFVGLAALAGTP